MNSRKGILRESENGSFELADLEVDQPHSNEPGVPNSVLTRRRGKWLSQNFCEIPYENLNRLASVLPFVWEGFL